MNGKREVQSKVFLLDMGEGGREEAESTVKHMQ